MMKLGYMVVAFMLMINLIMAGYLWQFGEGKLKECEHRGWTRINGQLIGCWPPGKIDLHCPCMDDDYGRSAKDTAA